MPLNPKTVASAFSPKQDDEEKGLLGSVVGKVGELASDQMKKVGGGLLNSVLQEKMPDSAVANASDLATKNIEGAAEMFNPATLAPALITGLGGGALGTAQGIAKLPGTAIAGFTGKSMEELDQSPLSFAVNTDQMRAAQSDAPIADKLLGMTRAIAPLATTLAEPIAETAIRGGAGVASAASQTGRLGGPLTAQTPEEVLAGVGLGDISYEAKARDGKGLATLIQDALTVAPAARAGAAGLASKGVIAPSTAAKIGNITRAAEAAPLAPITLPGRALARGIGRASRGETAFPNINIMAQRGHEAISRLPSVPENVATALKTSPIAAQADDANTALLKASQKVAEAETAPGVLSNLTAEHRANVASGKVTAADQKLFAAEKARLTSYIDELPARQDAMRVAKESVDKASTTLADETSALTARFEMEQAANKPTLSGDVATKVEGVAQTIGDIWAKTGLRNEAFRNIADRTAVLERTDEFKGANEAQQAASLADMKKQAIEEAKTAWLRERGEAAPKAGVAGKPGEKMIAIDSRGNKFEVDDTGNIINKHGKETHSDALREAEYKLTGEMPKATKAGLEGQQSMFDDAQTGTLADENLVFVPEKELKLAEKAMEGVKGPKSGNAFLDLFDTVTRGWKAGVLPMNPAWQANNIVSNTLTAMTHGGVDARWAAKNWKRVANAIDDPTSTGLAHALGAGSGHEFIKTRTPTSAAGRKLESFTEKAYKLNSKVDDVSHMAVALKKFDDLKAKGIPEAQAARQASDFARKTMGDFENMSAFEKNVIKRAIPFYTWAKHSAKFIARETLENPARQVRYAALGQAIGQKDRPEGAFLESAIGLGGGRFLNTGALNLGQTMGGGLTDNPLTNPKALLGATNPLVQAGMAFSGIDPKSGQALSTAPDQSFLSGAGGYLSNQNPLLKTALDTKEYVDRGENVAKGDTRNVITAGGRPISARTEGLGPIPAPLLKLLTGVSIQEPDLRGQEKRAKEKEKTTESKKKKYKKDVDKAAK